MRVAGVRGQLGLCGQVMERLEMGWGWGSYADSGGPGEGVCRGLGLE